MPHDKVFTFGVLQVYELYRVIVLQISDGDPSHGHNAKYESIGTAHTSPVLGNQVYQPSTQRKPLYY